jgi:hypothetical protein
MENGIPHGEGYYKLELGASGNLIHSHSNQPRSTELPVTGCIHPPTEVPNLPGPGPVGLIPRKPVDALRFVEML